jgi:hypothetical protein
MHLYVGQPDQMKADAPHPVGIAADGASCESETAGSGECLGIVCGCVTARLLEEFLPPLHAMGNACAFTLYGNCAVIKHVLHEHQGFPACRHGRFRRH